MLSDYPARRVLLCLRYGIGDVVMERPVLEALRSAMPDARITALGAEPAVELLHGDAVVDEVVSIQRWGLTHRWDGGTVGSRSEIGTWIDREQFDLFLDVHHAAPAVGAAVWSRGIRSLEASEAAEARAVARGADGVAAIKDSVREGWGMEVPEALLPRLALGLEERRFASEFLERHGVTAPPVGISPVASSSLKRWSLEGFAEAADRMAEQTGSPVLLFCGPQDEIAAELLGAVRSPERIVPVGPYHLRRVAALLARCGAFLCNDTGLMHVAAAVGTRTVAVFGPTPPRVYCPPQPHASSVGGDDDCPHRNLLSLHPPACWEADECLIADSGCTHRVGVERVLAEIGRAVDRPDPLVDPVQAAG